MSNCCNFSELWCHSDDMHVMKNSKVAYCVDLLTVHHCTKFRSCISNLGDFKDVGHFESPWYHMSTWSPILITINKLAIVLIWNFAILERANNEFDRLTFHSFINFALQNVPERTKHLNALCFVLIPGLIDLFTCLPCDLSWLIG